MKTIPAGYHAVTPWIVVKGVAELVDFMQEAFGAKEKEGSRVTSEDGTIAHVEVQIDDSVVMAFDANEDWPETPSFLRLYVKNGDATFRRALRAGATPVTEMTDLAFGDRVGRVRDNWGNLWWIHQHIEDADAAAMAMRLSEPAAIEAMRYVEESLDAELVARAHRQHA
ncbi:MAG: VOC family protein [Gemmatimonadaceae bacterium]